ncbi:MAG: 50S ribosomal protein L22 [bacterium]
MEVKAKLRFLRMSPKRNRALADVIRGLDVVKAQTQLQFAQKAAARPLLKLLNSAIANAENNHELDKNNLFIKEIRVDQGPTLKRWQPKAHGRATPIRKRSCHISIILGERVPSQVKQKVKAKVEAPKLITDLKDLPETPESAKLDGTGKAGAIKEASAIQDEDKSGEVFDPRRQGKQRSQEQSGKKGMKKGKIKKFFTRKAV